MSCLRKITAAVVLTAVITQTASAYQLLDSNYTAQNYASFTKASLGTGPYDLEMGPSGSLYMSFWGDKTQPDGKIIKIDTNGNSSDFVTGLYSPRTISAIDDYLYFADLDAAVIKKFDEQGNVSVYKGSLEDPQSVAFDITENYNNKMFYISRGLDNIYAFEKNGDITVFSELFGSFGSGPVDILIDNFGNFNNQMFVSYSDTTETHPHGIYTINTSGSMDQFLAVRHPSEIELDTVGLFDYKMFVSGYNTQTIGRHIFKAAPDGSLEPFIDTHDMSMKYSIGNDGALYVSYIQDDIVNIDKITPIPEPASLLLLSIGAILFKRK